jgi:hypothetical protein
LRIFTDFAASWREPQRAQAEAMNEQDVADGWRRFQRNWIMIAGMGAALALCLAVTNFSIELPGLVVPLVFVAVYAGFAYANAHSVRATRRSCSCSARSPRSCW